MVLENKEEVVKSLDELAKVLTGYDQDTHDTRYWGDDWPASAVSMIGINRMHNLRDLLIDVIENDVPGDFIETGVWRGGACIFASLLFKKFNINDRKVWVCDSFQGLPPPDPKYPLDDGDIHHGYEQLRISLENVKANFERYQALGDNVEFVKGWFCDTLPTLPAEKLSVMRLDGDMYSSTMDSLSNLYPKLSPGGYVIIDDYGLHNCRGAVHDYREANKITSLLMNIDDKNRAVYWKKD